MEEQNPILDEIERLRDQGVGLVIKAFPKGRGFSYQCTVLNPDTGMQVTGETVEKALRAMFSKLAI